MSHNHLFLPMVCRLRWYKNEMRHRLIRYKHGLSILLVLLVPDFHALSSMVITLVRVVLTGNVSLPVCFLTLFGLQSICVSWAAIQKPAILGTPFRHYLYTLPISFFRFIQADVLILLIANLLLFIPFMFILLEIKNGVEYVRFFILTSGIIISQMIFLYQSCTRFAAIALSDVFFVLSASVPGVGFSCILLLISCGMQAISILPRNYFGFLSVKFLGNSPTKSISCWYSLPFELAVLMKQYTFSVSVRLSFLLAIAVFASLLLKYSALNIYYWATLQCFMTIMSGVGSAYFTLIHEASESFRIYLKTLPCRERCWNVREFFAGTALIFAVSVLFLCVQWFDKEQVPLQTFLYCIRTRYTVQGTFLSFFISAIWAGILLVFVDQGIL
jgi:hypothetical protein